MKKVLALIAALCLMVAVVCTASADSFYWGEGWTYNVNISDARIRAYGDGENRSVFFVTSYGNGSIELCQCKGTCQELSYTKLLSGITGTAEEWGKYEIHVVDANGGCTYYDWDSTFNNDSITLKFKKAGNYYVDVRPYTTAEMTDSYVFDMFAGWMQAPQWWIDDYNNCSCSTYSPYYGY